MVYETFLVRQLFLTLSPSRSAEDKDEWWAGIVTGLRIASPPQVSDDDQDGSKHTDPEQDEVDPVSGNEDEN